MEADNSESAKGHLSVFLQDEKRIGKAINRTNKFFKFLVCFMVIIDLMKLYFSFFYALILDITVHSFPI